MSTSPPPSELHLHLTPQPLDRPDETQPLRILRIPLNQARTRTHHLRPKSTQPSSGELLPVVSPSPPPTHSLSTPPKTSPRVIHLEKPPAIDQTKQPIAPLHPSSAPVHAFFKASPPWYPRARISQPQLPHPPSANRGGHHLTSLYPSPALPCHPTLAIKDHHGPSSIWHLPDPPGGHPRKRRERSG